MSLRIIKPQPERAPIPGLTVLQEIPGEPVPPRRTSRATLLPASRAMLAAAAMFTTGYVLSTLMHTSPSGDHTIMILILILSVAQAVWNLGQARSVRISSNSAKV